MHVIDVQNASFGYGDKVAAKDVTFAIEPGEVVALLGHNGSGKTTVVRGILGLADTRAGQVRLFGEAAEDFHERWRIGYVPQRHTVAGAIPSTVREVVSSGRLPRKRLFTRQTKTDRAAVYAAIDQVALSERCDSPVGTLSGGQQRRVLIARALAGQPDVLVMDEPTAGVDAENAERLTATLERLVSGGLTLLIVTHELAPLRSVLTRAITMRDGQVIDDSPASDLDWQWYHDAGHDPHHEIAGHGGKPTDPLRTTSPGLLGEPDLSGGA